MKMKIGLMRSSAIFEQLLAQEKVPWEIVKWNEIDLDHFSIILVNEKLPLIEKNRILSFLESGGAVLTFSQYINSLIRVTTNKVPVKWLITKPGSIFHRCCLLDLYDYVNVADSSKLNWIDEGLLIQEMNYGNGKIVNLSYDMEKLFSNSKIMRKQFYDNRDELASERVSKVSKGNLRRIFVRIVKYLADYLKIPYCSLPYGKENKSNFIFRIDTDFCQASQALDLYEMLEESGFKATWFVDTSDTKMVKDVYSQLGDHEVGLHCHRHKIFRDYKSNRANLTKGSDILREAGIDFRGFAAPYGEWNPMLDKVLQEMGFQYSSEFGLDYDNLPWYPLVDGERSSVLQIPIHPISMGRLIRSHYHTEEIFHYYQRIIDRRVAENLPVIIYYHPHRDRLDILHQIFQYVKQKKMVNMTMGEYRDWWIERQDRSYLLDVDDDSLNLKRKKWQGDIILTQNGKNAILSKSGVYKMSELNWGKEVKVELSAIEKTRKHTWRNLLYNFESMKGKAKQ